MSMTIHLMAYQYIKAIKHAYHTQYHTYFASRADKQTFEFFITGLLAVRFVIGRMNDGFPLAKSPVRVPWSREGERMNEEAWWE